MEVFQGVVENRNDPLKLGRCQVRVIGLHTHDKSLIKTADLPWAYPLQPVTSAAMSGIGQAPVGPVEGTWVLILFRDIDQQYPIMIGTIGGIPQDNIAVDADLSSILFKSDSGAILTDAISDGSSEPLQTTVSESTESSVAPVSDITTEPPPEFTTSRDLRKQSIIALLAACDKLGITSREQKCTILALAGGESGWIPTDEGYNYSADALKSTFSTTFVKNHPESVTEYARCTKTKTREEFFNFVYDPSNNGKQLGNTQSGDGGKYFGRGLTGITGRSNYTTYGNAIGVNLLNNPSLLNTDLTVSALASVAMIKLNTESKFPSVQTTANPEYFYAAKKAQGHDTGDGAAKRLKYYEYFYGQAVLDGVEEKSPDSSSNATTSAVSGTDSNSGVTENSPGEIGFRDPNNKYPLKNYLYEPDTNRLARGIKKGTIHQTKDSNRALGIKVALSSTTIDEPKTSYGTKYPFNHVYESESGHVTEIDDTPNYERMVTYHRKGTFTEVDPNGTEVHHIVGDQYHIVDRNGVIYIVGECNLTVGGNVNILCESNVNLEVTGDMTAKVGGDYTLGVAGNYQVAVGGTYKVQSSDTMSHQTNSNYHVSVASSSYLSAGSNINQRASGNYAVDATRVDMNSGAAGNASAINLVAPAAGIVLSKNYPYLVAPQSEGEDIFLLETEEDWNTPAGVAKQKELAKQYPPMETLSDEATPVGGVDKNVVESCIVIHGTENFTDDFKLSANFTLGMLIDGGVNGKNRLKDQLGLTKQEIVCNLSQLCANILEPMLEFLPGNIGGYKNQWKINSGFRSSSNIPTGGASVSDHMYGRALDFTLLPADSFKAERNFQFVQEIEKILPYDQMILEFMSGGSNWIHIGYRGVNAGDTKGQGGTNRKMAFTMVNGKTYKKDGKTGFYLVQ